MGSIFTIEAAVTKFDYSGEYHRGADMALRLRGEFWCKFYVIELDACLTAVISAIIDTAISGGVWLPMASPTGACRRDKACGEMPNSNSLSRRFLLLSLEPKAPT